MNFRPHDYQKYVTDEIIRKPRIAVFMEMGLGKTASTLNAIDQLMYNRCEVDRVLVITKKSIARLTWPEEIEKWDNFRHLSISPIIGTPKQRLKALNKKADIYTVNVENVEWLLDYFKELKQWPFQMLVVDESSLMKKRRTKRTSRYHQVEVMSKVTPRVVLLTGTPTPNGYLDLFGQIFLLDFGKRFSTSEEKFKVTYFYPNKVGPNHEVYSWRIRNGAKEIIEDKIKDISFSLMSCDHIKMPDRVDNVINLKLGEREQAIYDEMEHDYLVTIDDTTLVALSAGVVAGKLLQMANGACYKNDSHDYVDIHDIKLQALKDIVDDTDQPVLVAYSYEHDLDRFKSYFKGYEYEIFDGSEKQKQRWDNGEIKIFFAHPAQAGHGLNLQKGGHVIVWFGLTWNLEHYLQFNARLYRQGQKETVVIHHLLVKGTMDEDVYKAIKKKDQVQEGLMLALKARIKEAKSHD